MFQLSLIKLILTNMTIIDLKQDLRQRSIYLAAVQIQFSFLKITNIIFTHFPPIPPCCSVLSKTVGPPGTCRTYPWGVYHFREYSQLTGTSKSMCSSHPAHFRRSRPTPQEPVFMQKKAQISITKIRPKIATKNAMILFFKKKTQFWPKFSDLPKFGGNSRKIPEIPENAQKPGFPNGKFGCRNT